MKKNGEKFVKKRGSPLLHSSFRSVIEEKHFYYLHGVPLSLSRARARVCVCYNTFQQDVRRRFCGRGVVARATSPVYYFVAVAFREEQIEVLEVSQQLKVAAAAKVREEEEEDHRRRRRAIERVRFSPEFVAPFGKFLGRNDNLLGRFPRVRETLASGERVAPDMGTRETNHSRHRGTAWRWEEHSSQTGFEAVSEAAKKK